MRLLVQQLRQLGSQLQFQLQLRLQLTQPQALISNGLSIQRETLQQQRLHRSASTFAATAASASAAAVQHLRGSSSSIQRQQQEHLHGSISIRHLAAVAAKKLRHHCTDPMITASPPKNKSRVWQ
jgi:hypothetical protein